MASKATEVSSRTPPLDQDSAAAGPVQRGLGSDGFKGMVLCDQEARVGLFYAVLDDYLEGRR